MSASTAKITIHDHSTVAPPPHDGELPTEQTLPLTYFDVFWVYFHPIQRLLFYPYPCSTTHFLEILVPNLKNSLSQSLKHYLPLAGKLILPPNSGLPVIRYVAGDSVSFTVTETNEDFDFEYWTGNQARDCAEFYNFVPELSELKMDSETGFKSCPLVSMQVTLIPGKGICVGISNHHTIGDASSMVRFIKGWSSVAKLGEGGNDEVLVRNGLLPVFDRSLIHDPLGKRVNIFWSQFAGWADKFSPPASRPSNFRETFIFKKSDLQKLRNSVLAKRPWLIHLSSFTISAAYVWRCLAKCAEKIGEEVDENEPEYFVIAVDARHRLDPPVPSSYFGNCLAAAGTESTFGQLKGEEGFYTAVELIGDFISKCVNNKDELMKDADDWLVKYGPMFAKRIFGVAGSPKFDLYDTDFGWGKPCKFESVSIDGDSSMSLCKSREFEGGLEIGLAMPKEKLDVFSTIFNNGLEE